MSIRIESDFDGGAIEVVSANDARALEVAIRGDTRSQMKQWFSFRVAGVRGKKVGVRIVNAGEATYADAFEGYRVCSSQGGDRWLRVPTTFDGEVLAFGATPASDAIDFAYFAPYSFARHDRLLARAEKSELARVETIGRSVEGRPMSMIAWGDDDGEKRRIWIQARQHPGETAAEWLMEGVLDRLLDDKDDLARAFLEKACFYLLPNMNPDGGVLGNHRTNAAGVDLNRAWLEPDEETSPEVLCVREKMKELGVDCFLDVHADERNPYIFAAGCEGNPSYNDRIDALEDLFMNSLGELDEDFQREYGYERDAPGQGDLSCAGNWVGEEFDCLSLTLEMPFKDDANHPDPSRGWSPERSKGLGRHALESVFVCLDSLR